MQFHSCLGTFYVHFPLEPSSRDQSLADSEDTDTLQTPADSEDTDTLQTPADSEDTDTLQTTADSEDTDTLQTPADSEDEDTWFTLGDFEAPTPPSSEFIGHLGDWSPDSPTSRALLSVSFQQISRMLMMSKN